MIAVALALIPFAVGRVGAPPPHASRGHTELRADVPERLELPGLAGAWFYRPAQRGAQRVLVYLHARNADPLESCRAWHRTTARHGWLVCPLGPVDHGNGRREWHNNADYARRESLAAIAALTARFHSRVSHRDHVVMGFSEGAFAAMNVGLAEPVSFPRWLILAAHDGYIDGAGEQLRTARTTLRRIYLLTGEHDGIVEHSRRAESDLVRAFGRRRVRLEIVPGAGHEFPPDFDRVMRRVLAWVTR